MGETHILILIITSDSAAMETKLLVHQAGQQAGRAQSRRCSLGREMMGRNGHAAEWQTRLLTGTWRHDSEQRGTGIWFSYFRPVGQIL